MSQGRDPKRVKRDPHLHRCQALRLGQPCGGLVEPRDMEDHLMSVHRIQALEPSSWFGPRLPLDVPGGEVPEAEGDA